MTTQEVKQPTKVDFVSQKDIVQKNRKKRDDVLRLLEELRSAQREVAASSEKQ